jgi:hypothetical protein
MHVVYIDSQQHIPRAKLSTVFAASCRASWLQKWKSLPKCGSSLRCIEKDGGKPRGDFHPSSFECLRRPWLLSDREYTFVLRARTETLPCGTNLHQWFPDKSPFCNRSSCRRKKDSGNHRLNSCPSRLPQYRRRHDAILTSIASCCDPTLHHSLVEDPSEYSLLWDVVPPLEYYGSPSSLRPDIQLIVGPAVNAVILDLKVPYHGQSFLQCHEKNVEKYQFLANRLRSKNFGNVQLDTLIVSSDGLIPARTAVLLQLLPIPKPLLSSLLKKMSILSIKESCRLFDKKY